MVYLVDRIARCEARNAKRRLATHLEGKWNCRYSQMVYYVRVRMSVLLFAQTASSSAGAGIDSNAGAHSSLKELPLETGRPDMTTNPLTSDSLPWTFTEDWRLEQQPDD
jgi:hypothetical protein